MRERPILFNNAMVRAILDGSKWQTRRPVKPQPVQHGHETMRPEPRDGGRWVWMAYPSSPIAFATGDMRCPFGAPGEFLWVRECWAKVDYNACDGMDRDDFVWCTKPGDIAPGGHPVIYRATCGGFEWDDRPESRWRPSIHMPRWASRLTLRVTDVRIERLQDITEEDARAEGVRKDDAAVVIDADGKIRSDLSHTYRGAFAAAWDSIYGKRDPSTPESWTANPWVWVVSFERVEVPRG